MVCRMVSESECRMRKKGAKKIGQRFVINGELVQNVAEYLGCVINEHVESKAMVVARATAGARALCAWLRKCRMCWRSARGFICQVVGGNGGVSVVIWGRGMGIL